MASEIDYFAEDPRTNRERMLAGDLYIADGTYVKPPLAVDYGQHIHLGAAPSSTAA